MGCNSHLSVEVREPERHYMNGWETYALDLPESRNYSMYTFMAGVRGDEGDAIAQPRDIPQDVSTHVKAWWQRWDGDGHTPSYLSSEEFREVIRLYKKSPDNKGYGLAKEWLALSEVLNGLEKVYGKENVRVVFFFDN